MRHLAPIAILTLGATTLACPRPARSTAPPTTAPPTTAPPEALRPMQLEPRDTSALFSVTVSDGAEVALLRQQLKLEPVRLDGTTLYFAEAPGLLERLRAAGYEPAAADRVQIERRVVRVSRRGDESELARSGVRLINRERDYWIVDGTLAQLRLLQRAGYRLSPIRNDEPRARRVRIVVREPADVQRVNELHVDIYSVDQQNKDGIVIRAGAFDAQIDALRAAGYNVQELPTGAP